MRGFVAFFAITLLAAACSTSPAPGGGGSSPLPTSAATATTATASPGPTDAPTSTAAAVRPAPGGSASGSCLPTPEEVSAAFGETVAIEAFREQCMYKSPKSVTGTCFETSLRTGPEAVSGFNVRAANVNGDLSAVTKIDGLGDEAYREDLKITKTESVVFVDVRVGDRVMTLAPDQVDAQVAADGSYHTIYAGVDPDSQYAILLQLARIAVTRM